MSPESEAASLSSFELFSQRIIPTFTYDVPADFVPQTGSAYLYGSTDERRAGHLAAHLAGAGFTTVRLAEGEPNMFTVELAEHIYVVNLYSGGQQDSLWALMAAPVVYLDLTGLPHHIWAPLVASAHRAGQHLQAIYVEPANYQRSPGADQAYDLSDGIAGIKPLPGFASLQPTGDNVCYVPILGFEGARFSFATNAVDPPPNKTFPVIGLPGFRPEYPFETYVANQRPLESENGQMLVNIQYADASCPFSVYYVLEALAAKHRDDILKVALLGTKPHALGAVLYAMHAGPGKVELVYDHPIRKQGRTSGIGRIYVFHVTFFISLAAPTLARA
ncbi:hypothetical protein [Hymenobacter terricola]|uniref:hypothetical protein n=1 Tax=Hymenobacter terricola TaxID=2819236 RepID=UPI001B3139C0|nr:hypothetical protein [Hymenobacter terricola]